MASRQAPFTMSQLVTRHRYGQFACVPRSVVEQNGKWRNGDESQDINDAFAFPETTGMMPPWWPAAVSRRFFFESLRRGWTAFQANIGGSCDDETAAYRATPPRTPQLTYALVVDPATGQLVAFQPRGLNFGLEAAVAMYSRKPKFLVAAARRFWVLSWTIIWTISQGLNLSGREATDRQRSGLACRGGNSRHRRRPCYGSW